MSCATDYPVVRAGALNDCSYGGPVSAAVRSPPAAGRHSDKATPGIASAVCLLNEMFSVQPTHMCLVASSTGDKQAVPVRGVCSTTRPMIMVRFVIVFIAVCVGQAEAEETRCEDLTLADQPVPCSELPNVCQQDPLLAHLVCPKLCGHCDVYDEWATLFEGAPADGGCVDLAFAHVCEQYRERGARCDTPLAQRLCAETCAHQKFRCRDHVLPGGALHCSDLPNVCDHAQAAVWLCPQFCNLCNASETAVVEKGDCYKCSDSLAEHVCMGMCDSHLAVELCLKTCFDCKPPITTTAAPSATFTTAGTTLTTTTSASTTPATTTVLSLAGSLCAQCGDVTAGTPCDLFDEIREDLYQRCDDSTPYCMNDVFRSSGDTNLYKRCVSYSECYRLWFEGSSDKNECQTFDELSQDDFVCHFCCYGDKCNAGQKPSDSTIFKG